jgi:ATP-dependent Clp protease ATP-binding subunit ClpB
VTSLDDHEAIEKAVMNELRTSFRPEFLNRIDETVVFHRLGSEQLRAIVGIQLRRFVERLKEKGLALEVSDAAKDLLVDLGFDPVYGARPLRRVIQKHLENPLAERVLSGAFGEGDTIFVERDGDRGLTITKTQPALTAAELN